MASFGIDGEALLAAIVDSSDDAIVAKDLGGIIRSWNHGAEVMFGYTAEEAIGHPVSMLAVPDRMNEMPTILERIRKGEKIANYETLRRAKDGRVLHVSLTVSPVRDAAGKIIGASKIARDITSQKQSAETLRIAEDRQRLALDAGKIGLWDWDIAANHVVWTDRIYEFHGLAKGDFDGTVEGFSKLVHPEDAAHLQETLRRALESNSPYELEFRAVRPNGEVVWLATSARVLRDGSGRAVRVLGALIDITGRKRGEMELRQAKQQLEEILNSIRESFIAVDRQWRVTYVNERVAARTGRTREELLGRDIWDSVPGLRDTAFWPNYHTVMEERIPLQFDVHYKSLDRWYEVHAYPTDEGLSAFILDVTERRLAEQALKKSTEQLRRANNDLEQFAYSASHDLKEPLRTATIYSQLLEREYGDKIDEQGHQYLQFVIQSTQRMDALVSDLLVYAQVAGDGDEGENESSVDADAIVDRALSNLNVSIAESGAIFERDALPRLRVKDTHLLQLFQNIVGNALKYRGEEQPRIRIAAIAEEQSWRLSVQDNGIGIDSTYLAQIFGLFKRLHTSERFTGTGVGLAICQKIVHRYGGQIWVESEGAGHGSTFFFTLPGADS